ncbi:MAG: xylulokinase [Planctomycetota bacterium]|jgi:xylulokinase|nr:xylulokinase [Planctomycetota bacterium]
MAVLGIDLGTSGCKTVLVDEAGTILASATAEYPLSTPKPLWSEQDPADWWRGLVASVRDVLAASPGATVAGIGIGGQMHGATLLDGADAVVRPAILWNDGRCEEECALLHERVPDLISETGNRALVGFTAPKLVWVQRHEPEVWAKVRSVLLPKDYLRFLLTGDKVAEMSDGAGMLLMDVAKRRWSPAMLAACEIDESYLGRLIEGSEVAGTLTAKAAAELGLEAGTPVVGGAGDQAAGAVGAGCVSPGQTTIALGTSGVVFTTTAAYSPEPEGRLHTFCHAVPDTWHQMGVMLSAAGSLQWYRDSLAPDCSFPELDALAESAPIGCEGLHFLPYLTGERTPLCDAKARGAFIGLTRRHDRAMVTRSVLEGVTLGLRSSLALIRGAGTAVSEATVTGGGTRSAVWMQMFADVMDCSMVLREGADAGPALGGARLALIGACGQSVAEACKPGPVVQTYAPNAEAVAQYRAVAERFDGIYPLLADHFSRL